MEEAAYLSLTSGAVIIGVDMVRVALIISLIRGTPSVMFILATPAKWNVYKKKNMSTAEC